MLSVCLAKAYVDSTDNEPIMDSIARMRVLTDGVELETLFGEPRVVPGRVAEVDFATSYILLHSDDGHENAP